MKSEEHPKPEHIKADLQKLQNIGVDPPAAQNLPSDRAKPAKPKKLSRGRGKETLFRVSVRNQIELIAIADNKANMITGLNALLMSLIMALFGSGLAVEGVALIKRPGLVIPFGILMFACLVSAVYAILAAKPKIIRGKQEKKSLLFFQNFYKKTLGQYMDEMQDLLRSRNRIYDQMIIDMYYNGVILQRKYFLLGISYTIFLVGIIATVVAYVVLAVGDII